MHSLDLPAGASIRLTATAKPKAGLHRWDVRVLAKADGVSQLAFGSEIGGLDCEQRIDIPAQNIDRQVHVSARHASAAGWSDNRSTVTDDTPSRLQIGFCDPGSSTAQDDDILLNFAFGGAARPS